MLALHTPDSVFSLRHVPSWLMLAFSAGCVNATAALVCARYVTHVTGSVTQIGMEWANLRIVLDLVLVLISFILVIKGRAHRGRRPIYSLPLVVVAVIGLGVAIAGEMGLFVAFVGAIDQDRGICGGCIRGRAARATPRVPRAPRAGEHDAAGDVDQLSSRVIGT